MKKLILPFVLGAMLISCSRDNDDVATTPNPENPTTATETPVLLTKLVNVEENGDVEITNFEYDGDKLTKIYGGYTGGGWSHESVITYTGDLITSIKGKDTGGEEETTLTYDEQKRLKQVVNIDKEPTRITTITRNYTHNADGTVVVREIEKTENINSPFPNTETEKTMTYTVVNGLITKVEHNENGSVSTDIYTYDDKNAPLKNIRGIKEAIFEFFGEGAISFLPHNMTSFKEGSGTDTYEYKYNDENYPVKATATNPQGNVETYEYFYNK